MHSQSLRVLKARLQHSLLALGAVIAASQPLVSQAQTTPTAATATRDISRQIDSVLAAAFQPGEPGAAVLVVKDGKTLLRKAYGLANVGKAASIQPGDVFRIGSMTKQFTAVAILLLEDEGRISVQDDITKFLPDYPTRGKRITVEHLLTHTSGIQPYTGMAAFRGIVNRDMKPAEVIDFFKNEPMLFEPGERYDYNNSGYFILGAIIEKVSGMSYAEFVAKRIFEPLGMQNSAFEGFERNGARRIEGHSRGRDGFVVAAPMSMTLPYAAGSLVSNLDDLLLWNAAIDAGKLLKPATWRRMFTPHKLSDGKPVEYGYGWALNKFRGETLIEHGGAINGFTSHGMRLPQSQVYVVVLMNRIGAQPGPKYFAEKAAAIAMGKPLLDPKSIAVADGVLEQYEGIYRIDERNDRIVVRDGNQLILQRGGTRVPMQPYSDNEFYLPDVSHTRFRFVKDESGKVKHMVSIDSNDVEEINLRIGDKPAEKKSITLAKADFDVLAGDYQLAPNFVLTISRDSDRYFSQATGQGRIEIFAESTTKFFVKALNADLTFQKDAEGKVSGLVLNQNGRANPAKKIR